MIKTIIDNTVRTIVRLRWFLLYVVTISTILWWYERRPAEQALLKMQGAWQMVEGVIPYEQLGKSYMQIDDNETWLAYPLSGEWNVQRDRITISRADNFFLVRRAFGFDHGNTRETEYIVCLKHDEMYILRGLARLDSVRENTIEKRRRVDSLPTDAQERIREYLGKSN